MRRAADAATHKGQTMTNQKQIRAEFWRCHPGLRTDARRAGRLSKPQNFHNAITRSAFVAFVDYLQRSGQISDALADRVTL